MTDDSIETELMTELTTGCGGGEERCRGSERNVNLFFLLWYFFFDTLSYFDSMLSP